MPASKQLSVAGIQQALEAWARHAGPEPPFYQPRLGELRPVLDETMRVEPLPLLLGRTHYERMWVVINRAIRAVIRHGVEPAVLAQNDFNSGVGRALDRLIAMDAALHAEVVRLRAEERHGGP